MTPIPSSSMYVPRPRGTGVPASGFQAANREVVLPSRDESATRQVRDLRQRGQQSVCVGASGFGVILGDREHSSRGPGHTPGEVDLVNRPMHATSPGIRPPSRATIMLVEDDQLTALTLAKGLESGGYWVCIAATASQACALLTRVRPDLIILDLMLPDTDGLVLTITLKSMTDAPIIICSARHGEL